MKLLLVAPSCDGTDVGEAWSAHQWVSRLGKRHQVTLLTTRRKGRRAPSEQLPGVRVIEWDDLELPPKWERVSAMLKPGYALFHRRASRWIDAARRAGERFELAHQLTPIALRYPSPLAGSGLPYVLGPLAGSVEATAAFDEELRGSAWFVRLRALDRARLRFDPWLRASYRNASLVLGVAPYVDKLLAPIGVRRIEFASETGVVELPPERPPCIAPRGQCEFLYVGRVVRNKGVVFAIRALARLRDMPGTRLTIVGAGDDLERCRAEALRLGLEARVRFLGRLPRETVEEQYRNANAFLFPSLREPSGNVVFESMRHGLPVIACASGGPGHVVVHGESGLLVDARTPESFVEELAHAMRQVASSPNLRLALGAGARARVASLALWDRKIDWMCALYEQVTRSEAVARGEGVSSRDGEDRPGHSRAFERVARNLH
ncbi:MAG: glycosyltransferase [Planctomycetota bacterium]|nr:glycosyltransferase [Planctomycetota bacterium]